MNIIARIRANFKRNLPVGMAEFHKWADRIIALGGKYADEDSLKFALASQIIHMDAKLAAVPDKVFVNLLRKAAANQVASQFFQEIKAKQAQKLADEQAAKAAAEVTATPVPETSSAPKLQ